MMMYGRWSWSSFRHQHNLCLICLKVANKVNVLPHSHKCFLSFSVGSYLWIAYEYHPLDFYLFFSFFVFWDNITDWCRNNPCVQISINLIDISWTADIYTNLFWTIDFQNKVLFEYLYGMFQRICYIMIMTCKH